MSQKYRIKLTNKERDELKELIKTGGDGWEVKRAYILLDEDAFQEGGDKTDKEISETYGVSIKTVERLRKRYLKDGLEITIKSKKYFSSKEPRNKYVVKLSDKERERLNEIIKTGKDARQIRWAHILLASDVSKAGKQMTDKAISQAYSISVGQVERLRKKYVKEGFEIAIKGKVELSENTAAIEERRRYSVKLSDEEREVLNNVIKQAKNAAKIKRSHILLGTDMSEAGKQMTDEAISEAYNVSKITIERLRKRYVEEGFKVALKGKAVGGLKLRKIDGDVEAHLIALSCGEAPEGYEEWSLRLLAEKMVELQYIDSISHESVRQVLKKTNSSPINVYVG